MLKAGNNTGVSVEGGRRCGEDFLCSHNIFVHLKQHEYNVILRVFLFVRQAFEHMTELLCLEVALGARNIEIEVTLESSCRLIAVARDLSRRTTPEACDSSTSQVGTFRISVVIAVFFVWYDFVHLL